MVIFELILVMFLRSQSYDFDVIVHTGADFDVIVHAGAPLGVE